MQLRGLLFPNVTNSVNETCARGYLESGKIEEEIEFQYCMHECMYVVSTVRLPQRRCKTSVLCQCKTRRNNLFVVFHPLLSELSFRI